MQDIDVCKSVRLCLFDPLNYLWCLSSLVSACPAHVFRLVLGKRSWESGSLALNTPSHTHTENELLGWRLYMRGTETPEHKYKITTLEIMMPPVFMEMGQMIVSILSVEGQYVVC